MNQTFERLVRILVRAQSDLAGHDPATQEVLAEFNDRLLRGIFSKVVVGSEGQIIGIAPHCPMTAALFFDRVWYFPWSTDTPPESCIYFGGSEVEGLWFIVAVLEKMGLDWKKAEPYVASEFKGWREKPYVRLVSEATTDRGFSAIPVYTSTDLRNSEYKPGDLGFIATSLSGIPIVDESKITWDQVLEFRADHEIRRKYRRLVHWFNAEMVGKSGTYIADTIAIRLEDYEYALRKHGIETVTGALEDLLDPRSLAAAAGMVVSLNYAGEHLLGILAGSGVLLGKAALRAGKILLNGQALKSGASGEIAYVYEAKKRLGLDS